MSELRVIRVAVVEDREEMRSALRTLLTGAAGFRLTGAYRTMEDCLTAIEGDPPDVALVDIGLPGMSGIEGIRRLKETLPDLQILMLTIYEDEDRIFEALCAGACGYLLKKTPASRLLESVREAATGGGPISPEVAARVIRLFRQFRPPEKAECRLTPHETRLLKMLVEGHNYRTAAAELGVTVHAVSFHMRHVYEKLQVHSKSEAVAKALRTRLV